MDGNETNQQHINIIGFKYTLRRRKRKIFFKMKKIQLYKKKYRSSVGAGDG
jgi:hypothetical protein